MTQEQKEQHLKMLEFIYQDLLEHINQDSVDKYYKETLELCKELIEKE